MVACSLLAQAAGRLGLFTLAKLQSRLQLAKITGLAAIFCTSLACGNAALKFIPVSFVQVLTAMHCSACTAAGLTLLPVAADDRRDHADVHGCAEPGHHAQP